MSKTEMRHPARRSSCRFASGPGNVIRGPRARSICLLLLMLVPMQAWGMASDATQDQADQSKARALIERTARDYIEGWYTANPERMARALHPDLVKRYVDELPSGRQIVQSVTREIMIEMTRGGGGSKTPVKDRHLAVEILDISGDIAVAKTTSSEFLDLLSLAKWNGQWVIVNILWRFQPGVAGVR